MSLPKELNIYTRQLINYRTIDDSTVDVYPAFIVPKESKAFNRTAKIWSVSSSEPVTITNEPVSGIKIVNITYRNSGSVYKALFPPNYLVDFRAGDLLESISLYGADPGELKGEHIWVVNSSQMSLVAVGSKKYKSILHSEEFKNLKKIKNKDLKIGGIYIEKNGNPTVFLGPVSTINMVPKYSYNNFGGYRIFYGFSTAKNKSFLWYGFGYGKHSKEKITNEFNKFINAQEHEGKCFVKENHKFKKCIGEISVPEDIIMMARADGIQKLLSFDNQDDYIYHVPGFSSIINMVPLNLNPEDHLENRIKILLPSTY